MKIVSYVTDNYKSVSSYDEMINPAIIEIYDELPIDENDSIAFIIKKNINDEKILDRVLSDYVRFDKDIDPSILRYKPKYR